MKSVWQGDLKHTYLSLSTSAHGLSTHEARDRLRTSGYNVIPEKDKREWPEILLSQFLSPLVLILIFASVVAAFLGDIFDTIIIITIVGISSLFGFFQEYKSERVLSELKKYLSSTAMVLRDGKKTEIDTRELVPGDVVFVELGDAIPADLRIIETDGITTDEGALTGESREVPKNVKACAACSAPQEITNGLFMGTTVMGGDAIAVVVATGTETFFGKTAAIFSSKVPESDFQLGIRRFGRMLIQVILVITVVIFIANYALGHGNNPLLDSALFALAIAVGIAPEALPAIMTITLSNGSMKLAKKKVITKKLASIEDLGNMDILCADKTGTLTEDVHLAGYVDLEGKESRTVLEYGTLCNAAVGEEKFRGNLIDVVIKNYAHAHNVNVSRFEKTHEIPFNFERRRMGQVVLEGRERTLIVKGAPESMLAICRGVDEKKTKRQIDKYHNDGYTVIAVASKKVEAKRDYSKADERGLNLLGFLLLHNPPRHTAKQTLERMAKLNVRLKILTGDDALVTKKLCDTVGFKYAGNRIILGHELDKLGESEIADLAERYDVFARVTPEHKLAIIEALRKRDHVVGFLGDGVNDAPSLRTADVGISVNTAVGVAKGASHIILLHKSLSVICDGVEEGRKTFGNISKYIFYTMSANLGNMTTVAMSSFFLPFIPLLPSQILLNNLVSDMPLVGVSNDNVDETFTKKPQKWNIKMMVKFMVFFGLISTVFDLLLIFGMLLMGVDTATFRTAWFLESLLSEIIVIFSLRTHLSFLSSRPAPLLSLAAIAAVCVGLSCIYFGPIANIFSLVPLSLGMLLFIGALLAVYFVCNELGKIVFFSRYGNGKTNIPKHAKTA